MTAKKEAMTAAASPEAPTTSSISFRVPKNVRRRCKIAAALDGKRMSAWCIDALDRASTERIEADTARRVEEHLGGSNP